MKHLTKPFFSDFIDNKTSQKWLKKSNENFYTNNGNIPKWNKAIELLNAFPKGDIELETQYIKTKVSAEILSYQCFNYLNLGEKVRLYLMTLCLKVNGKAI